MLVLRVFFFIPSSHKLALALKLKQPWRVDQVHQDFGPVAHVVSGQISGESIRKSGNLHHFQEKPLLRCHLGFWSPWIGLNGCTNFPIKISQFAPHQQKVLVEPPEGNDEETWRISSSRETRSSRSGGVPRAPSFTCFDERIPFSSSLASVGRQKVLFSVSFFWNRTKLDPNPSAM